MGCGTLRPLLVNLTMPANVHEPSRLRRVRNARFFNLPQNGGEGAMNPHTQASGRGRLLSRGNLVESGYPIGKGMLLDERRLPWAHRSRGSSITSRIGRSYASPIVTNLSSNRQRSRTRSRSGLRSATTTGRRPRRSRRRNTSAQNGSSAISFCRSWGWCCHVDGAFREDAVWNAGAGGL
jgi:hypothetical protein